MGVLLVSEKSAQVSAAGSTLDYFFYNKHQNAFVASSRTLAASHERGRLLLNFAWSEPSIEKRQRGWQRFERQTAVEELTID